MNNRYDNGSDYNQDYHQNNNNRNYNGGRRRNPLRGRGNNMYETLSVSFSYAGVVLLLLGCCCNVYILIPTVIVDVVSIVLAILSRQLTRNKCMTRTVRNAFIVAIVTFIVALFLTILYSSVINNPEFIAQLQAMYEEMGTSLGE